MVLQSELMAEPCIAPGGEDTMVEESQKGKFSLDLLYFCASYLVQVYKCICEVVGA